MRYERDFLFTEFWEPLGWRRPKWFGVDSGDVGAGVPRM